MSGGESFASIFGTAPDELAAARTCGSPHTGVACVLARCGAMCAGSDPGVSRKRRREGGGGGRDLCCFRGGKGKKRKREKNKAAKRTGDEISTFSSAPPARP